MNTKSVSIIISSFLLIFSMGCGKDRILNINDDPNSATYSTAQLTIPLAIEGAGRTLQSSYNDMGMWLGYTANNNGFALSQAANSYDITANYGQGLWDAYYLNIKQFDYVEKKAVEGNFPLYQAVAKLFMAYDYACLVDIYNNVPFSDALLKGNSFTPKYDDGSAVYDSCVQMINDAIAILKTPATEATVSEATDNFRIIMFKGSLPDLSMWIKFANSLKLKLLVTQSKVSEKSAYLQTQAAQIDPNELLGVGDDALIDPGYLSAKGKTNPFYGNFFNAPGEAGDNYKIYHANNYALDFYNSTNDPRISYFYDKMSNGTYVGNNFGNETPVQASAIGAKRLVATDPVNFMTAAEALFTQAEAIQLGWISGNAKSVYEQGVKASFNLIGVSKLDSTAQAYCAQDDANTNWDKATDKIKLIITQKWAALNYTNNLAVYNDYRRTGFPQVPRSIYTGAKAKVPLRFIYPQTEYNKNAANVKAQGTIDPQTSTVFWDK